MLGRAVDLLNAAIDEISGIVGGEPHDSELADLLIGVCRAADRVELLKARLAARANREGVGAIDGASSTAAWIRWRTGMRDGEARRLIADGEALDTLPATEAAWAAGEISTAAARTIARARVEGAEDELAGCEPGIVEIAKTRSFRDLDRAVAEFRRYALADIDAPLAERRGLYASTTFERTLVVSGEFDPLNGEIVSCALAAATDLPSGDDPRSTSQRRADGLVRICRFFLDHGDAPTQAGERPHVTVVVDWHVLAEGRPGRCETGSGIQLSPAVVQRVLCDAKVARLVVDGESCPLDVGRAQRTVPPPMRRAIAARDRGCCFPGCDRPPGWCEAHHIEPWLTGGTTSTDNLALVCSFHHDLLHQPGWTAIFDGTRLIITRPDGIQLVPPIDRGIERRQEDLALV